MILSKNKHLSFILPIFASCMCLSGLIYLQSNYYNNVLNQTEEINFSQKEQSEKILVNLQSKIPAFGFNNLMADWIFLNFVQYFGDTVARKQTGYPLTTDYFEAIVKYDPRFTKAYLTLSTANSIYAGKPEKTIILMEQVLQSVSPQLSDDASFLWTAKGLDELLFLGDTKAAKYSYTMAAKWADQRGDYLEAKKNLKTAQFLANNPESKKVQIAAWTMILPNIVEAQTRQQVINKINSLKAQSKVTERENKLSK
jgi:hypothetical protein